MLLGGRLVSFGFISLQASNFNHDHCQLLLQNLYLVLPQFGGLFVIRGIFIRLEKRIDLFLNLGGLCLQLCDFSLRFT